MVRSIGADQVIDYTQADFTKSGETYNVIFDVVGKSSFTRSVRSLTHHGRYLLGNSRLSQRVRGQWMSRRSSKKVISWKARTASEYTEDFKFLKELIEAGKIQSVIDRCSPLEQTAEAHRYVDTGQKKAMSSLLWTRTTTPNCQSQRYIGRSGTSILANGESDTDAQLTSGHRHPVRARTTGEQRRSYLAQRC